MGSTLFILAIALIGIGVIWSFVCSLILVVRAFRESILWGLVCLFTGVGNLIFVILHWQDNRRVVFAMLGATAIILLGYGLILQTPMAGMAAFHRTHRALAQSTPAAKPEARPAQTPTHVESKQDEKQKLIQQKQDELRELYGALTAWAQRLQERRKSLHQDKPDEVRAFNDDYAGYQASLIDYKNQAAQLKKLQDAK